MIPSVTKSMGTETSFIIAVWCPNSKRLQLHSGFIPCRKKPFLCNCIWCAKLAFMVAAVIRAHHLQGSTSRSWALGASWKEHHFMGVQDPFEECPFCTPVSHFTDHWSDLIRFKLRTVYLISVFSDRQIGISMQWFYTVPHSVRYVTLHFDQQHFLHSHRCADTKLRAVPVVVRIYF